MALGRERRDGRSSARRAPARRTTVRPGARPAARRTGARTRPRPTSSRHPRRALALPIGAGIITLVLLVGLFVWLGSIQGPAPARHVWVLEKTTAASQVLPEPLAEALSAAAAGGGGELVAYAVGERAARLAPVSLTVERLGDTDQDPERRRLAIEARTAELRTAVDAAPVGQQGYSLYAALQAMADEARAAEDRIDVWFSTTLLTGSVDPLRMPALAATDPATAVEEIVAGPIGRLRLDGVDLHPVLLVPVGTAQEPLTAADEAWRTDFVTALGTALGATVVEPVRSDTGEPPWGNPSAVDPVVPLRDPTPTLPCADTGCPIDNLAFVKRTADLVDEAGTRQRVADFVAAVPPTARIRVTGYTAAFGTAESSRELSRQRAEVIGALLVQAGVAPDAVDIEGLGFDRRADPSRDPQDAAQRVVVMTVQQRARSHRRARSRRTA